MPYFSAGNAYNSNGFLAPGGSGARWTGGTNVNTNNNIANQLAQILAGTASTPVSTSNKQESGSQTANKSGVTTTNTSGIQRQTGVVNTQQKNMTDTALAALNNIIAGQNKDPLLNTKDRAAATNIQQLQAMLAGIDPTQAAQMASGQVADLRRKLAEQLLPQITGASESAGFGTSALSRLLAQDAAVRTAEAQNRAIQETYMSMLQAKENGAQVLGQLTDGTSANTAAILQALDIAKGAIENKREARDLTTTDLKSGDTTENSVINSTSTGSATTDSTNPLGWASILSDLLKSQMSLATGPSVGEKQLAAFMAAGGNPAALIGPGWGNDNGYRAYQNDLMGAIKSFIG